MVRFSFFIVDIMKQNCSDIFKVCSELEWDRQVANADRGIAEQKALDMCAKYDDNFDILDNLSDLDNFLTTFVATFDDTFVRLTPPEYKSIEGAGLIARKEEGEIHVGVDDDVVPSGDIVPVFDGLANFMSQVSIVVRKADSRRSIVIPEVQYTLSKSTKLHRSNAVVPMIEKMILRRCVFIDPPHSFSNYCDAKGCKWYTADTILPEIDKLASQKAIFTMFERNDEIMTMCDKKGYKSLLLSYNPYYPISARHTESVEYTARGIKGTAYINRRVFKYDYRLDAKYVLHPYEWSKWLELCIADVHVEWLTMTFIPNFLIEKNEKLINSRYFPYVVEAHDEFSPSSAGFLPVGEYHSCDNSEKIIVRDAPDLMRVEFVSSEPLDNVRSLVTVQFSEGDRIVQQTLRTYLGWPYDVNFFMLRGQYYRVAVKKDQTEIARGTKKRVNFLVATEMSNIGSSIVAGLLNVDLLGLSSVFKTNCYAAYYQHYMAMECSNIVENAQNDYQLEKIEESPIHF